jgi:hypothetical protein
MINRIKLLTSIAVLSLLSACGSGGGGGSYYQPQSQLTPLEACIKDAVREDAICGLAALGSVKSGVPASYYQCGERKAVQEDRCNQNFNPNYISRPIPRTQDNQVKPQQQQRRTTSNATLVRQWIGRNAERYCQYSDGNVKNVGMDLCD